MNELEIKCQDCGIFIPESKFRQHQLENHEFRVQEQAIASLVKIKDRVKFLLEKFPQTRSSDKVLCQKYFQYWESKDGIRLIWNSITKQIEFNRNPSFDEYLNLDSHETITRAGRAIRKAHPELQGSERVQKARELKEDAYHGYFAGST